MRVMIFQPDLGGHHMILYVRHIAREVLRRGWNLHLVTTYGAPDHPAFPVLAQECGDRLEVSFIPDARYPTEKPTPVNHLAFQFRQHRLFARAYAALTPEQKPDVIFVENVDHCEKPMSLLGSPFGDTPFVGLLMDARFHHRRMGVQGSGTRRDWLHEWLFRRLVRIPTLRALMVIDEPLAEFARRTGFPGAQKVRHVHDAASMRGAVSREEARHSLGIRPDQIVVLVYGLLAERKGVAELLSALSHASCPPTVVVLLAGMQDASVRSLLASDLAQQLRVKGRLNEVPEFLDDAREHAVFRASDIAWLGYRGFYGMSGVLVQAGAMSLPVIACSQGIIGWLARKHQLGVVVDSSDVGQVVSAITQLALDPAARWLYGENGRRMAERHAPSRFAAVICDALADAVPIGDPGAARTPAALPVEHSRGW